MRFLIAGLTILAFVAVYVLVETDVTKEDPDPSDDFFGTRDEDCASCHYSTNQTLAGGKHAGRPCSACHDPNIISQLVLISDCTDCHGEMHDYNRTSQCVNCHDPHATGFTHDVSNQLCQDCHSNETAELHMGPHTWQDCTNCHQSHTSVTDECDSCHGTKHSELVPGGYVYPECLECHNPMNTSFRHDVENDQCMDCHSGEYWKLQTGGHSGENCTDCHPSHEEFTISCDECHGQYHGYSYPKCLECHEPMQATPGSPEFVLSQEVIAFAVVAVLISLVLSILLIVHMRKKEESSGGGGEK
ncbi:MAG: hypothetical protein LN417_03875 [Candidatus Thermoplasmatota archaeon]|nr:hypothetical protein [Candidatus Thermoplasmatota archaeon]